MFKRNISHVVDCAFSSCVTLHYMLILTCIHMNICIFLVLVTLLCKYNNVCDFWEKFHSPYGGRNHIPVAHHSIIYKISNSRGKSITSQTVVNNSTTSPNIQHGQN